MHKCIPYELLIDKSIILLHKADNQNFTYLPRSDKMIVANLANKQEYYGIHPELDKALDFLLSLIHI